MALRLIIGRKKENKSSSVISGCRVMCSSSHVYDFPKCSLKRTGFYSFRSHPRFALFLAKCFFWFRFGFLLTLVSGANQFLLDLYYISCFNWPIDLLYCSSLWKLVTVRSNKRYNNFFICFLERVQSFLISFPLLAAGRRGWNSWVSGYEWR